MELDQNKLSALDSKGYVVIDALAHDRKPPEASHASPHAFVCIDGRTYWVKNTAQQGLVAELIVGRLATKVTAGPDARIVRVVSEALPADDSAKHLVGLCVGTEDKLGTVNARHLQPLLDAGDFQLDLLDRQSLGRVMAFQTWVGVGDNQVLIELKSGVVWSIDHGEAFSSIDLRSEPAVIMPPIPGVTLNPKEEKDNVRPAIEAIEKVSDQEILQAVAGIPVGEPWRSPAERRFLIAEWLSHRRDALRGVIEKWLKT